MCIIQSGHYIKLYRWSYYQVIDEIFNEVNNVKPWMPDDTMEPSRAFCLLYKLFTMKLTVKQIQGLLKNYDSPYITAIGFLYRRYVADPKTLWAWYEPYLKDNREFSPGSNGRFITMGVYVRDLILGQYYFDSMLPKVPRRVIRQVILESPDFMGQRIRLVGCPLCQFLLKSVLQNVLPQAIGDGAGVACMARADS